MSMRGHLVKQTWKSICYLMVRIGIQSIMGKEILVPLYILTFTLTESSMNFLKGITSSRRMRVSSSMATTFIIRKKIMEAR